MNNLICWHDGEYKSLSNVTISPLDFGFIHSDATYDVLRIKNGKIMFYDLHHSRFTNSCKYFHFDVEQNIKDIAECLIERNNIKDAFLWLCNWRGIPPSGSPRDMTAPQHSLIYVKPYYGISSSGLNICIDRNYRRTPDTSHKQEYKNFAWVEFNLAQRSATNSGFDTAILLTNDNYIAEGPGFGVCFVKDNQIITSNKDVLKSVTIDVVEMICKDLKINFLRKDITEAEALSSQEAFVCSTSGGITPINSLTGHSHTQYSHTVTQNIKTIYDNLN